MDSERLGRIGLSTENPTIAHMPMTLDQLKELVDRSEDHTIDLKAEVSEEVTRGLSTDIAALANYHGGFIVFGVTDTKDPKGCRLEARDRDKVSQQAANCNPPITIDLEQVSFGERQFLVVKVPESRAVHSDYKHRFPIRIGNTTNYLDTSGLMFLFRDRGLIPGEGDDYPYGFPYIPLEPEPEEWERSSIPESEAELVISALESEYPTVRLEIIEDLMRLAHRHALFENPAIASRIRAILESGEKEEAMRVANLISNVASFGTKLEVNAISEWIETMYGICESSSPRELVYRVFEILQTISGERAIDLLVNWITELEDEKYDRLQPHERLHNAKYVGIDEAIRLKMYALLMEGQEENITKRITDVLEAVRRSG